MSATLTTPKTTSGGEIITHLINSTDGTGLHFDGAAGTFVNCTDTTILDGATRISIEAIFTTATTSTDVLIAKGYVSNCYELRIESGIVKFAVNNGSSTVTAASSGTYNDGNPKHVVATWDNATLSIYINGNLDGTAALAGGSIPNTTDKLALGAYLKADDSNSNNLDGILYRARLWNKALTQAEVTASYENATVPFADQYGSGTELITSATNRTFDSGIGNWAAVGVTPTNDSGALKVDQALAYDGTGTVASFGNRLYFGAAYFTTPTSGKKYRLQFDAKAETGGSKIYATPQGSGSFSNISNTLTTSFATYVCDFDIDGVTTYFVLGLDAAEAYWLDNISLTEIGCVSDYDLAFANQKQSLVVEDRSGSSTTGANATGMMSASGVTQVTPIEQLNSKSARIGTTAATPADGELLVGGKVGIGVGTPLALLHVQTSDVSVTPNVSADNLVVEENGNAGISIISGTSNTGNLTWGDTTADMAVISYSHSTNDMSFRVNSTNDVLTLDSAGNVGINDDTPNRKFDVNGTFRATGASSLDGAVNCGSTLTAIGGIVETNGVLKSNLLTNSGFDVWSNSTLEDVGSELVVNGDFASATGWTEETGWNITGGEAVASGVVSNRAVSRSVTLVIGKLYKLSATISDYTSGTLGWFGTGGAAAIDIVDSGLAATGTTSIVFEATATTSTIGIRGLGTPATFAVSDVSMFEKTPGCVAAGAENVDGWQRRGGTATKCWRQHEDATLTKDGSFYSLKTTSTTSAWNHTWPDATLINDANFLARFAGRTVTAGCWVYSTLATPEIRLNLYTGTDNFSTQTVAQNTWTWLETTTTCPDALANFYFQLYKSGATSETYYVSQVCLVFGSAIGSGNYSRPSGEIVNCEKEIAIINNESPVAATDKIRNLESDSSGKIPKGAKAITVRGYIQSSAVSSGKGVHFGPDSTESYNFTQQPVVVNFYDQASGVINCDSNGDIYQVTSFTGSTASAHYMAAYQVQLR